MHLNHHFHGKTRRDRSLWVWSVILLAGALGSIPVKAGQWTRSQFAKFASVLFYNANSTALPGIPGLTFTPYPNELGEPAPSAFISAGLAPEAMENDSSVGGYSLLDITFNPPVQAVGGYPFPLDTSFNTITETVYDVNSNVIESASSTFFLGASPVFLGIGETTTNISKVEWKYSTANFFGVANIIYQPGLPVVLTNTALSSANITFKFQSVAGHTNLIETCTNLTLGSWTILSNLTLLGDAQIKKITIPMTNGPSSYFRVQAY
jgi:hypothetical protein